SGKTLAGGWNSSVISIWDAKTGNELQTFGVDRGISWVVDMAFSPAESSLAATYRDYDAKGGDLEKKRAKWHFPNDCGMVSVAYSPDGKLIATGSLDHTVTLWDAETGKQLRTLEGVATDVRSLQFSPDGEILAAASSDSFVWIWNVELGTIIGKLEENHY